MRHYQLRVEHTDVGLTLVSTVFVGDTLIGQYWAGSRHIEVADRVADAVIQEMLCRSFDAAVASAGCRVDERSAQEIRADREADY